ncbi:hypothetical protein PVAND_015173 [Polypedilum vanderplanki]|uniref:Uncharacterized protein n=1 Tax=Polypedilum vanderplanki TaxID=319348 RepID=A0A9J6BBV1_POLVA|nr:hypothetical protein PVAND_015173 [Polypedilum vanderplanki]
MNLHVLNFFIFGYFVLSSKAHFSEESVFYPCVNKFYRYNLDDEPAEYGLSAGYYAPNKTAYVGLGNWFYAELDSGRIQLNPPGIWLPNSAGQGIFLNESSQIWYLGKNHRHKYKWVDSKNLETVPFAIEYNFEQSGFPSYIGRIKINNFNMLGIVAPFMGGFYYVDEFGQTKITKTGYQVLTCKTKKNETRIPLPKIPKAPSTSASSIPSCVHNWQLYKNDDAPKFNGISASEHDCDVSSYVGKGKNYQLYSPGRIQTTSPSGFYFSKGGIEAYMTNGSYYLVDNLNYSYYWINYDGNFPSNAVLVTQDVGKFLFGIARLRINGHMQVGMFLSPVAGFSGTDGLLNYYNYEVLVCDPWPKYKCTQQWKEINANILVDGFSVDSTSFIGRGIRKCINGCDYGLGKIQSGSNGVNYLDDLTATAIFDNSSNVEYLVKNPSDTYKWQPSRNGVKVVNALELHKEGHRPFYIGMTRINDNIVVGKVRPGDGLFFIDPVTGKQQSTSSYEVLTCTSPDASNGEYEEENVADWFGSFGCPIRKEWSFTKWRCVCRDEFRGVFAFSEAKWNEETCSYI